MKWDRFRTVSLIFLILICLLLTISPMIYGAEIEFLDQLRWNANIAIYGSRKVGQSFVARGNRLNKIAVFMANPRGSSQKVIFHLGLNPYEERKPEKLQFLGPSVGEIYGPKSIGQTFLCSAPTLSGIKILMANYDNRMNDQDVIFHLKKSPKNKRDLRKVIINASRIKDNQYAEFSFSPIYDAQDNFFYFYIESPTSYFGNAITARYSPSDICTKGERYVNGVPATGDLLFKEGCEADLVTLEIRGSQIRHNTFHEFVFPLINNSYKKSFYFYIELPEANARNAVYFQYDNSGRYSPGKMYVDGLPYQGSLTFKTYYYIGLSEITGDFLEHLFQDIPFSIFYFVLGGFVVFLLIAAITIERRLKKVYRGH